MKLYKYTTIEYVTSGICYGVFASRLDCFNDPYEYEGIRYLDDYRVCCMTSSAKQMLMWAYYGNHRGCCIEYSVPDGLEFLRRVQYTKDYHCRRRMGGERLIDSLYTKAYEWGHEKEYRAIYYRPEADYRRWRTCEDGNVYLKAEAKAVIFGLEVDFAGVHCQRFLRFVRDNYPNLMMKQCMLSESSYSIRWDKQFDYLNEII